MDRKTERLQLRLSKQELTLLRYLVLKKGVKVSEYICAIVRKNAQKEGLM